MICVICGVRCRCKRAKPFLCCACHSHNLGWKPLKRPVYSSDMPITEAEFDVALAEHSLWIEQRVLVFGLEMKG